MKNLDFLNKIEIDTFVYSSAKEDRYTCKDTVYLGRNYTKWGEEQIVTFFGFLYSVENTDTHRNENVLLIGMSKQHPEDIHHDKKIAIESARINALMNPFMTIENVSEEFNKMHFVDMMKTYLSSMDLDLIMTSEELRHKKEKDEYNNWCNCDCDCDCFYV